MTKEMHEILTDLRNGYSKLRRLTINANNPQYFAMLLLLDAFIQEWVMKIAEAEKDDKETVPELADVPQKE